MQKKAIVFKLRGRNETEKTEKARAAKLKRMARELTKLNGYKGTISDVIRKAIDTL